MNGDVEIEKRINVSTEDMLFIDDIISENKIIINVPLIDVVGNDLTRAAMLTRYMFFYKHNNYQEFSLPDKKMAEYLHTNLKTVERQKRWLKENGLISVRKVGLPAIGLITVNISIIRERYIFEESRTLKMRVLEPLKRGDIYNNIEERDIREKENTKRNPASGSPSSPDVDELKEDISSLKIKKVKKLKDYEKDEVFYSFWKTLPEYMRGCGPVKAYKVWVKITENGLKNVEEIKKSILFYLKTLPEWQHPQHLSTFLNQGTWEEFYTRAAEQDQKQERARALREKQQKEEAEQRKRVLKERAQVFEAKYQALKNKLNAGYDTLEEISQENEELFYDVIQQIRDYERKLEEKEAEKKKQQELEHKKIDAENSKQNLDECERELWTYISQAIDVNAYLDRNKKRFPNSYETFKALFSNGETLLDVVFGELAKDTVVDRLKNNILSFLINEMANEEARNLYNKRNDAWTKWNQLAKAML